MEPGDVLGSLPPAVDPDAPESEQWVGQPDAAIFAPGTNVLTREEFAAERAKGNVMTLAELRRVMAEQPDRVKRSVAKRVSQQVMENTWLGLGNGRKVSYADLHAYVNDNPELQELASRNATIPSAPDAASTSGGSSSSAAEATLQAATWYAAHADREDMQLPAEAAARLPWGRLAAGEVWSRRPTRWLAGLDGVKDWEYAAYCVEDEAARLLGPKYAGKRPEAVLSQQAFYRDVMSQAPGLGMTFMVQAARQLPLAAAAGHWGTQLKQRLRTQQPDEAKAQASLARLQALLEPARLLRSAGRLLDSRGAELRAGSTLLITTAPGGRLLLQAWSPDKLSQRQYYMLGTVSDPALAWAVTDLFMGPDALEPEFVARAGKSAFAFANGFKTGNSGRNPDMFPAGSNLLQRHPGALQRIPAVPSVFRLPDVGQAPGSGGGMVVSGIRDSLVVARLRDVFSRAISAGLAAAPPERGSAPEAVALRRAAADRTLADGLAQLLGSGPGTVQPDARAAALLARVQPLGR